MGITHIDREKCIGCGICQESCPTDVIRMEESTGKAHIAFGRDCCTCYLCVMDCPVDAIEVAPNFARPRPLPS